MLLVGFMQTLAPKRQQWVKNFRSVWFAGTVGVPMKADVAAVSLRRQNPKLWPH